MNDLSEVSREKLAEFDFQAERRTGVGGSDSPILAGLSPYGTPFSLYLEKRGDTPPSFDPDNRYTRAGRAFESVIAHMYSEETGLKLRRNNRTLRHPDMPWLMGHIDREIVGQRKGLEIKNVSPQIGYRWGRSGDPDGVPEYYLPQVHHYLLVTGLPAWDVAAYFGGADLRIYTIERDPEWDDIIAANATRFWHEHVIAGVPPEIDPTHPTTLPLLARLYPGTDGTTIDADDGLRAWARVAREAGEKSSEYDSIAKTARAHLLHAMGASAVLRFGDGTVFRRKEVKRKGYEVAESVYVDARFGKE